MGIAYSSGTDFVRHGVKTISHTDFAGIQCFCNRKRLHGRTRLDHIGNGTVTALFAIGTARLVRIIGRTINQSQNFAGLRIQYHNGTCFGFVISHCFIQFIIGKCLNTLIQRQNHVLTVFRIAVAWRIQTIDDIAFIVAKNYFRTVRTMQTVFTRQFQTFLTFTVDIGETDNVRKQVAHRIMAFQLFLECQAFNAQGLDFFRLLLTELTLQIDKVFIFFKYTINPR